ncbi:unnamed protein product [Nezara viridula]|uniref:Uncharacterized protein n=1 Tax=Nezara viridula TaxID=85310 RepID=A0A9P0MTX4_NEZVI|nr:unnamed protein product [Nezara viridula]
MDFCKLPKMMLNDTPGVKRKRDPGTDSWMIWKKNKVCMEAEDQKLEESSCGRPQGEEKSSDRGEKYLGPLVPIGQGEIQVDRS